MSLLEKKNKITEEKFVLKPNFVGAFTDHLTSVSVNVVRGRRVVNTTVREDDFTKDIPICHYNDPKVTDCIQKAAEHARLFLAHGVPSLGIQSLEPLKVPSIRLRQHNTPGKGFRYDAWLSDVTVRGLTDYTFNSLDVFPEELRVTGNLSLPNLYMTGEFVVLGHFQMLPVEATGKMVANFSMCTAAIEAVGARVHNRMVVKDANVHLSCSGPLLADLSETHSATGEMEKITDHIVNMHSNEIVTEIQPAVETALAMVLEDVANKFLKHVPYDMVFPK